jgi:hypothetical protein
MNNNKVTLNENSLYEAAWKCASNALNTWIKNYKKKYRNNDAEIKTFNHFDVLFPNERRIHAFMQSGLTSFGKTFWEPLAYKLASKNGFEVLEPNEFNKNVPLIPSELKSYQQEVRGEIELGSIKIKEAVNLIQDFIRIKNIQSHERTKCESGKGIDFWFKKNNIDLIGDIKSPQENIGNGKKLIEHILIWSTYRLLDDPSIEVDAVIAFPYNPYKDFEQYMKQQGSKFPLLKHGEDILIADHLWDRLSGVENSTEIIFDALRSVSKSDEVQSMKDFFYSK